MKPTSPEEREIEEASAEVSARYREAANDEPSARLDAAILQAARTEAARGGVRRNWRVPAAVAAVLVVGVSLSFMTKEVIDPLPPMEHKHGADAAPRDRAASEMAKPAAPSLAMKSDAPPEAKEKRAFDSRPSRERGERADREAEARRAPAADAVEASPGQAASSPAADIAPPAPAAAAPARTIPEAAISARRQAPAQSEPALQDKAYEQEAPAPDKLAEKKGAPAEEARSLQSLRKSEAAGVSSGNVASESAAPPTAEAWVRQIEALVAQGRQAEAKVRLAEFRKRYPDYRLPEALRKLEPGK
jgi:hypothetical protein